MQIALECPSYLLRDIQPLADFDWILTHLVNSDEEYAKFYRESNNIQVLDNSVNELLEPCSLGDMERAEELLGGVDLIVPPDFLGDSLETESYLLKALKIWEKDKILPCIQGSDLGHVIECADYIVARGFTKVAVPYDITCVRTDSMDIMASSRILVVYALKEMGFDWIHLLGMTTVAELKVYKKEIKQVKSIDTGVPIVYGMNCMHLDEPWDFKKDKPTMSQMVNFQEFMDFSIRSSPSPSDKLSAIFWNIAYLRKVIADKGRW